MRIFAVVANGRVFFVLIWQYEPKNRTNQNELSSGFNDKDRQQLTEINVIKKLVEEVKYLKEEVEENKLKYEEIKTKTNCQYNVF